MVHGGIVREYSLAMSRMCTLTVDHEKDDGICCIIREYSLVMQ